MIKNYLLLILLISVSAYSQTNVYELNVEKDKKITTIVQFDDNSFAFCSSKDTSWPKKNSPNLIRVNENLNEIYNTEFIGFDSYLNCSHDGAMINKYYYIKRSTSNKRKYNYIDKNGEINELDIDLLSGGEELSNSTGLIFLANDTQYTIGPKINKRRFYRDLTIKDFYLSKYDLKGGTIEISKLNLDNLISEVNNFYYVLTLINDNGFTISNGLDFLTFDFNGKLVEHFIRDKVEFGENINPSNTKPVVEHKDLSKKNNTRGSHFIQRERLNYKLPLNWSETLTTDTTDGSFYDFGFYHSHKNKERKIDARKYKGFYINKFNSQGKLEWQIQEAFISEEFDQLSSYPLTIIDLFKIDDDKLIFTAGQKKEEVFEQLIIDSKSGEILEKKQIEFELDYNNHVKFPLTTEHRLLADDYGKNVFFDIRGVNIIGMNKEFSDYAKKYKDRKDKIHFSCFVVSNGFVVLESDNKNHTFKLLRFDW